MKGPEPWDIFGLYAEERWSITVSGKERDKNYELKKQADKGRLKQSQLFKLKKKRWWGEGKKVNKSLLWRGESKSSPDDGWQKWKWVYTTARMLHTIIPVFQHEGKSWKRLGGNYGAYTDLYKKILILRGSFCFSLCTKANTPIHVFATATCLICSGLSLHIPGLNIQGLH